MYMSYICVHCMYMCTYVSAPQVVNNSQCNIQFEWDWNMSCVVEGNEPEQGVIVRVDPPRGTVGSCVPLCIEY